MSEPDKYLVRACGRCGQPHAVISGAWLRWARKSAGLDAAQMGAKLRYRPNMVKSIEKGERTCYPRVLATYEALVR